MITASSLFFVLRLHSRRLRLGNINVSRLMHAPIFSSSAAAKERPCTCAAKTPARLGRRCLCMCSCGCHISYMLYNIVVRPRPAEHLLFWKCERRFKSQKDDLDVESSRVDPNGLTDSSAGTENTISSVQSDAFLVDLFLGMNTRHGEDAFLPFAELQVLSPGRQRQRSASTPRRYV